MTSIDFDMAILLSGVVLRRALLIRFIHLHIDLLDELSLNILKKAGGDVWSLLFPVHDGREKVNEAKAEMNDE